MRLAGGVSMAEAELIDDYHLPARTEHDPPPSGFGQAPPWQALTLADLDRYSWGNFSFQDARGIRYHAPAFIRSELRGESPGAIDSLEFALSSNFHLDALVGLLTPAQGRVLAEWLAWRNPYDGAVIKALDGPYRPFLTPDQRWRFG